MPGPPPLRRSAGLRSAGGGRLHAPIQPRTYYLVNSQGQADALRQTWADAVYEVGLPDLPFRQLVVIGSPAEEQQLRNEVAAFGEDGATTRVEFIDLRSSAAEESADMPVSSSP